MLSRNMSLKRVPLETIEILALSESNSEIDSTSHYRESTTLQYPMYIIMRHQVLRSITYYLLHADRKSVV